MMERNFFDAECRIGKSSLGTGEEMSTLLREMDKFAVARALVRDFDAGTIGAKTSNARLSAWLKADKDQRLAGVWNILPECCHELPSTRTMPDEMKANRIAALSLQPEKHRYVPARIAIGSYMDMAAEHAIPVLTDGFFGRWEALYSFMAAFPDNTFILLGNYGKWGVDRQIRPLLEAYPKTYFCLAGYWVPQGIQELVALYGADRFLFGSGFPEFTAGSAMLHLVRCGLPEEAVRKIASGNLEKLLKGGDR